MRHRVPAFMLLFVSGEFEVQVEDVGPDVRQEIVGAARAGHVVGGELAAIFGVAPMFNSAALAEEGIDIVRHIPRRIDARLGGFQILIDHNAIVHDESRLSGQFYVRRNPHADADEVTGQDGA